MPIYEYECTSCNHTLESIQKMSDAPLTDCPICNKNTLQKLMSASGFQLKGTGWYATDFKDKGKVEKKTNTDENKAVTPETTTGASSEAKSDTKSSTETKAAASNTDSK